MLLQLVEVMSYRDWFSNAEPAWHIRIKPHCVGVYDSLTQLANIERLAFLFRRDAGPLFGVPILSAWFGVR